MEKVVLSDSVTIYRADCLEVLPVYAECTITDPPYDVHAGAGGGCFGDRDHLVGTGGFTDGGCDYSFLHPMKNWFCFCSRKQLRELIGVAAALPRFNILTWCKPNPVPTCNNKYLPDVEYIVHGFQSGRLFGDMGVKSSYVVCPCGKKDTEHPNEKPLDVIAKLVRLGTEKGETILDPFMGSGTTGVACIRTNRKFIGIEIDETYFQIARKRIENELAQGRLF